MNGYKNKRKKSFLIAITFISSFWYILSVIFLISYFFLGCYIFIIVRLSEIRFDIELDFWKILLTLFNLEMSETLLIIGFTIVSVILAYFITYKSFNLLDEEELKELREPRNTLIKKRKKSDTKNICTGTGLPKKRN